MKENNEETPPKEEKFVAPSGSGPLVLIFSLVFSFVATMALISTVSFFCSRRVSFTFLYFFNFYQILRDHTMFSTTQELSRHNLYSFSPILYISVSVKNIMSYSQFPMCLKSFLWLFVPPCFACQARLKTHLKEAL